VGSPLQRIAFHQRRLESALAVLLKLPGA